MQFPQERVLSCMNFYQAQPFRMNLIGYSLLASFGGLQEFRTGRDEAKIGEIEKDEVTIYQFEDSQRISCIKFKANYYEKGHGQVS